MQFNAKLEAALMVEFSIADQLREQILEAISELNNLTKPKSVAEDENAQNNSNIEESGNHIIIPVVLNADSLERAENMQRLDEYSSAELLIDESVPSVSIDCFPQVCLSELTRCLGTQQVPTTKLSYLNHAELLKKYSGI